MQNPAPFCLPAFFKNGRCLRALSNASMGRKSSCRHEEVCENEWLFLSLKKPLPMRQARPVIGGRSDANLGSRLRPAVQSQGADWSFAQMISRRGIQGISRPMPACALLPKPMWRMSFCSGRGANRTTGRCGCVGHYSCFVNTVARCFSWNDAFDKHCGSAGLSPLRDN